MEPRSARPTASARRLARLAFGIALVLSPFGWQFVLRSRATGTVYGAYTHFLITAADLAMGTALALWGFSLLQERRFPSLHTKVIAMPLGVLTLCAMLSAPFSVDPALSAYHSLRLAAQFGLFLFLATGGTAWQSLALPAALMVTVQAAVGIGQFFLQGNAVFGWLGELRLDPARNGVSIVFAEGQRWLRAYGLTNHPNLLGGSLTFALLVVGECCARSRGERRAWLGVAFGAGALALFFSFSRAAWLALLVGTLVLLWLLWRARQRDLLAAWLVLCAGALAVVMPFAVRYAPLVTARLNPPEVDAQAQIEDEGRSIYERGVLNDAALALLAAHPLTGVGLGALPSALSRAYPNLTVNYQPAHIVALTVGAEIGLPGAAVYLVLTIAPWLALARNRRHLSWTPALVGASALLAALTVVSLFDYYPWTLPAGRFWQWSAWGLWSAAYGAARGGRDA